jgi:PDZ domain-containing secreted protein
MHALNKTLAMLMLCVLPAFAQQMRMLPAGEIFELRELGAILGQEGEHVKVMAVMPKEQRPQAYQAVDIAEGDLMLFLNGKRVKSVKEFGQSYNSLALGDTIKLGVRRKEERLIAAFAKIDPKDLPVQVAHRVMVGGDGQITQEKSTDGGKTFKMSRTIAGNASEITPIPGLGVILGSEDGKVKIIDKLPIPVKGLEGVDLQAGDALQSLNGNAVASVSAFNAAFEKIAVGAKVELQYLRKDKSMTASFNKPEVKGQFKIRTN